MLPRLNKHRLECNFADRPSGLQRVSVNRGRADWPIATMACDNMRFLLRISDRMPSSIDSDEFDVALALRAADALKVILQNRTRVKVILGEERVVPGTLGEVIRLPTILARLQGRSRVARDAALAEFRTLWSTLSEKTTSEVLLTIGWYDPTELDWEDPRSNRRPDLRSDDENA